MPPDLHPAMHAWATELRGFYTGLDMTLAELQSVLGVDPATLSRYLKGKRLPEIEFLGRMYTAVEDKTGAALLPAVRANVRALYFAACAAHDPNRHEVYVLRDALAAAQRRAQEAEDRIRTLEARLSIEQSRRGELESRLTTLEAVAVPAPGGGTEVQQLRDQRAALSQKYEDNLRSLTDQMRELRTLEDAYRATEDQLHEAERRLDAGLELQWSQEEADGENRRWRKRPSDGPVAEVPLSLDAARQAHAAFGQLGRRTQALLQRQLAEIDHARQALLGGQSPHDALGELETLATRARRNSENLLLLAGETPGRVWPTPVPLVEVLHHAAGEVEQRSRVDLANVPSSLVGGREVAGLIRLFAELLDNATRFSAPATRVTVNAVALPDGGTAVAIHDAGIGLSEEHLEIINAQLSDPPQMPGSRRQGLYIVGLLAAQHQASVRLDPHPSGGTSAHITLSSLLFTAGQRSLPAADATS
ncbi:ATP-binding protein [Actinacidiphila glaucinigra]|uniref:ATP-binding protein n=1 Tax=Actinacidiphila glaucinigra TaxID=235986 RepID=UPI0033AF891F